MRSIYRLVFISIIASALIISTVPSECSAYPFKFEGYLKDDNGLGIPLATIYITGEIYDMASQDLIPRTWNTTTDEYGYYKIYLAANEPDGLFLDTEVTITYGTGKEAISTTVTVTSVNAWGNLTYEEEFNPMEFLTSPVGIIMIVIIISVVIFAFFIVRSEKDKEVLEEKPRRVERRRGRK